MPDPLRQLVDLVAPLLEGAADGQARIARRRVTVHCVTHTPFRRLDAARTAGRDGHGLGLSIVAAIASSHDAGITTEPGPDGGLDVLITFVAG